MASKALKKLSSKKVNIFKIRNRKGYAAICLGNLTEGKSRQEAIARLKNPLKRMGFLIAN